MDYLSDSFSITSELDESLKSLDLSSNGTSQSLGNKFPPGFDNSVSPQSASNGGMALKVSPSTTMCSTNSTDTINTLSSSGSPGLSPVVTSDVTSRMRAGSKGSPGQESLPFVTLSPAVDPNNAVVINSGVGKRAAATSTLSRLSRASGPPVPSAKATVPFPAQYALPNFNAAMPQSSGSTPTYPRSPADQSGMQSKPSPIFVENDIIVTSSGATVVPTINHDPRLSDPAYGTREFNAVPHTRLATSSSFASNSRSPSYHYREEAYAEQANDGNVYLVQFKIQQKQYINREPVTGVYRVGDFVKVEGDRGNDLGIIIDVHPQHHGRDALKSIVSLATPREIDELPEKFGNEESVRAICESILPKFNLGISIIDCEYQFDKNKITIYYETNRRVDHRDFVKEVHAFFKTRIWMEPVTVSSLRVVDWAVIQLRTGQPQPQMQRQYMQTQRQQQQLVQENYRMNVHQSPYDVQRSPYPPRQTPTASPAMQPSYVYSASPSSASVASSPSSGYSSGLGRSPHIFSSPHLSGNYEQKPYVIPPPNSQSRSPRQAQHSLPAPTASLNSRFLSSGQGQVANNSLSAPMSLRSPVLSSNSIPPLPMQQPSNSYHQYPNSSMPSANQQTPGSPSRSFTGANSVTNSNLSSSSYNGGDMPYPPSSSGSWSHY